MRLAFLLAPLALGAGACSIVEDFDGYVKDGAVDTRRDETSATETGADPDEGVGDVSDDTADDTADTGGVAIDTSVPPDTADPCPGQTSCGGSCVTTASDPSNCGGCGVVCSTSKGPLAICSGGKCACPADTQDCAGTCTRTASDPLNCGTCGKSVNRSEQCVSGAPVCRPNTVPCTQWMTTGGSTVTCSDTCTDVRGDGWHCVDPLDSSKSRCYSDTSVIRCVTGKCYAQACPSGRTECTTSIGNSRSCFSLSSDSNHCGSCTNKCGASDVCVNGACVKYRVAKSCVECVGDLTKCCAGSGIPSTWDHETVCLPATSPCPL